MKKLLVLAILFLAIPFASHAITWESDYGNFTWDHDCPYRMSLIEGNGRIEVQVNDAYGVYISSYSGSVKVTGLTPAANAHNAYYGIGTVVATGDSRIYVGGGEGTFSVKGNYNFARIPSPTLCQ